MRRAMNKYTGPGWYAAVISKQGGGPDGEQFHSVVTMYTLYPALCVRISPRRLGFVINKRSGF
jgi:hypothetical protein